MNKLNYFRVLAFLVLLPVSGFAADAWPTITSQTLRSGSLPSGVEPSGAVYEPTQNKVYVVSGNKIFKMNPDGSSLTTWTVSYSDLEGIAITGSIPSGRTVPYLYIGHENAAKIAEFDPVSGTLTGKNWNVSAWIDSTDTSHRMEGITFVPDGHHFWGNNGTTRSEGVFLISMQDGHPGASSDAPIIAVDIDLDNSGVVSKVAEWVPVPGRYDIADLFYSTLTRQLYILYDNANRMKVEKMNSAHTQVKDYTLPSTTDTQEAFAFMPNSACTSADVYIGEDGSGKFWQIGGFTYACLNPGSFTATASTNNKVNLAWANRASGQTGFQIERATSAAGVYAFVGNAVATATTYQDTVPSGGTYYYRVRALFSGFNYTDPSKVASATVAGVTTTRVFYPIADTFVDSLKATSNATSTVLGSDKATSTGSETRAFLKFSVSGLTGTVQSAKLRVYATDSSSAAPKVMRVADTTWSESMAWAAQPVTSTAYMTLGSCSASVWIEIPVSITTTSNGTYAYAFIPMSTSGFKFGSRESSTKPELVIVTTP